MATKIKKRSTRTVKKTIRRHVKQSVVPHRQNDYRPHLIRRYGLVVLLGVIMGLQGIYNVATSGSVLGQKTNVSARILLDATNQERLSHHRVPLKLNEDLSRAAYDKAADMFKHQYWAHVSPAGVTPWTWVDKSGYHYQAAGENLAKGFHTSGAVMTAWMNSTEHRENILDQAYRDVGFAVLTGELQGSETTLVVAMYGEPKAGVATAAAQLAPTLLAPPKEELSLAARFGVALQSLTPAVLTSVILLLMATVVALVAHGYRKKLPRSLRQGWYRHHGLYKAVGMASLVLIIVALYGGGQI